MTRGPACATFGAVAEPEQPVRDGTSNAAWGPGVTMRRLRLSRVQDLVVLRGILMGYDGLVSPHGDRAGDILALAVPDALVGEVDALLEALRAEVSFTIL